MPNSSTPLDVRERARTAIVRVLIHFPSDFVAPVNEHQSLTDSDDNLLRFFVKIFPTVDKTCSYVPLGEILKSLALLPLLAASLPCSVDRLS